MSEDDIDVAETYYFDEFDIGTTMLLMTDGSLRLKLALMPPSWYTDEGAFEAFEDTLAEALGVEVEGLDKEFFGIQEPTPDTIAQLRNFLLELRRKAG